MSQIQNAMPQANLLGVDDQSKRVVPYESQPLAIHIPHVFTYAAWGPEFPLFCAGSTAVNTYGTSTFLPRGPYSTHQWPLIERMITRGNPMVVQRIRPIDAAPPATLSLYLDVLQTDVPEYTRNEDGSFRYDEDGAKIPTGKTVKGLIVQWVIEPVVSAELGRAKKTVGKLTGKNGVVSTIYPIQEFQVSFFGAEGNNCGISLWAPTMESTDPVNSRVVTDQLAQLYRLRFIRRANDRSTGRTVRTLGGAEYMDFSFRDDVVDAKTGQEFGFDTVVLDAYRDLTPNGSDAKRWGPFNKSYIYSENLTAVLRMMASVESAVNTDIPTGLDDDGIHLMNFISGVHYTGVPYHAIQVNGPNEGASALSETAIYYASGGTDGTMSKELFDEAVGDICEDYAVGKWNLADILHYPVSAIYDTGFDIDNKFRLLHVLSARKDIAVFLSTQDVSLTQNTIIQESSMAVSLKTQAALHPESEYYGTPVLRAAIIGHSGYLINSKYRNLVPLTVEVADKISAYAGNSRGILLNGAAMDVHPNNIVSLFRDVNCTFKHVQVRNKDWTNGLVWVESFDQTDALFFPAFQTAYDDDTSILNSIPTMLICSELEKVCVRVWARLSGRSDLTNEQFAQRSDELIREHTERRFDNRVVIEPQTYYTTLDEARGYSWSCKVKLYGNNMKTVGSFTIEAHRQEELSE